MKNVYRWASLGMIAVVSVAVVGCKKAAPVEQPAPVQEQTPPAPTEGVMLKLPITVPLEPQNGSGIRGTATLTEVNGKAKVVLQYANAPQDLPQPAHIHAGSCAELGAVKYPLTSPINGASVTQLEISVNTLLGEKPWAINVHKSVAEANSYVACGDKLLSNTQ